AVSVNPTMLRPANGANRNVGDSFPSHRVSIFTPAEGLQRSDAEVSAFVSLAPPRIKLPFSTLLSPSIRHPNVVSPSNKRIHPSSISFGVSLLAFGSSAWTVAAKARMKIAEKISRMLNSLVQPRLAVALGATRTVRPLLVSRRP